MLPEKELIYKCKNKSKEAFEKLVLLYQKRVYNFAYKMLGNIDDAYDVSQEVFIRIYKSINSFNENSLFSTWVYRITKNLCIDFLRKTKNHSLSISFDSTNSKEQDEITLQIEDKSFKTDEKAFENIRQKQLNVAISKLSYEHRTVIILRDINGLSYNEIADILGCNLGTVKSKISRARETLKAIILKEQNLDFFV